MFLVLFSSPNINTMIQTIFLKISMHNIVWSNKILILAFIFFQMCETGIADTKQGQVWLTLENSEYVGCTLIYLVIISSISNIRIIEDHTNNNYFLCTAHYLVNLDNLLMTIDNCPSQLIIAQYLFLILFIHSGYICENSISLHHNWSLIREC